MYAGFLYFVSFEISYLLDIEYGSNLRNVLTGFETLNNRAVDSRSVVSVLIVIFRDILTSLIGIDIRRFKANLSDFEKITIPEYK